MATERLNAVLLTQEGYVPGTVAKRLGAKAAYAADLGARNLSIGAIPHLGAHYLAAYLTESDRFNVRTGNLFNPEAIQLAQQADLTVLSALDIGVDRMRNILGQLPKDKKVIAGGYGVTGLIDRLAQDYPWVTFVPGEGEEITRQTLDDFLTKGIMKPIYRRNEPFDLKNFGEEPYTNDAIFKKVNELFSHTQLKPIQVTKGCSQGCDFCPTARLPVSYKRPGIVTHEIERMKVKPWEAVFFVDQNLLEAPKDYLRDLFTYINNQGIHWIGEGIEPSMGSGSIDIPFYRIMGRNCLGFLLGLEEIGNPVPGSSIKNQLSKPDNLSRLVKALKEAGVPVAYSIVFGTDQQQPGYGKDAAEIVNRLGMNPAPHILTPRPGTVLGKRYGESLLTEESGARDMGTLLHDPKNMTATQVGIEYVHFMNDVYNPRSIKERFARNLQELGLTKALYLLAGDLTYCASLASFVKKYPDISKQASSA